MSSRSTLYLLGACLLVSRGRTQTQTVNLALWKLRWSRNDIYIYTVYTELQGKMITHWIFLIHVFFSQHFWRFPQFGALTGISPCGSSRRSAKTSSPPSQSLQKQAGWDGKTQLGGKTRVSLGNIQLKELFGWLYMISYSIPQLFKIRFHVTAIFCSNLQTLIFFEEIHSWSRSNRLPLALYHQEDDLDNHAPGRMTAFGVRTPGSKMFIPRKSEPCSQFLEWEQYIKVYESVYI